jgi:ribulose-phosphate 3-epimerase
MNLYPSILTGSKHEAQDQLIWIAAYPKITTVQFDVIDGQLVDNVTLTPVDFAELDFGELSIDLHLMTEEPLDFVYEAIAEQKNFVLRSIIAQVERMSSQAHYIDTVRHNNWQVGLSLDLFTPFDAIDDESWQQLDIVQLMGVELGYQGQAFQPSVLEKIKDLVALRTKIDREFEIIIDGGVKPELVNQIEQAGADGIVVGSALWQSEDQAELDSTIELLS